MREVLRAYSRLSRSRPYEQGQPLPITFDTVDAYCRRFGPHDPDEFARFLALIEAADNAYLERSRRGKT